MNPMVDMYYMYGIHTLSIYCSTYIYIYIQNILNSQLFGEAGHLSFSEPDEFSLKVVLIHVVDAAGVSF